MNDEINTLDALKERLAKFGELTDREKQIFKFAHDVGYEIGYYKGSDAVLSYFESLTNKKETEK